jgi:murein DD-endopeptidase MepM/ murein hydrolase activator NlpD
MLGRLSPQDEVARLAESLAEETRSLRILDALMARAARMLAAIPNRWPVRGAVNSEFGTRLSPWTKTAEFHGGMDIRAERGTPVQAPANGTVTIAGPHAEYGLTVILDHGNDIRSIYGHLSKVRVKVGDRVERGVELGLTGNTGRSSGPHLHYEVLVKGQAVNPRTYLWD